MAGSNVRLFHFCALGRFDFPIGLLSTALLDIKLVTIREMTFYTLLRYMKGMIFTNSRSILRKKLKIEHNIKKISYICVLFLEDKK